jgi:23S rRNA (cytidine1920-2'-O)/16S rRNA (cytidine1409-2'-O)-methyltransferase
VAKVRVDVLLQQRGLAESREQAQRLVSAGRVRSGTTTFVKASQMVAEDAELVVTEPERFVSRGGLKLEGALDAFGVDVAGRVCLDLGASTGGFTDCLLQRGASRVIAVDVGRAQLHQRLREDPRVVLLEQTNARDLPALEAKGDSGKAKVDSGEAGTLGFGLLPFGSITLFVADLSFISLRKVLPSVAGRLAAGTEGVVLLKPQFEAGPKDVPRGGVIRDVSVLERVKAEFLEWLGGNGWHVYGMIASPIRGGDGNQEFLVHLASPGGVESGKWKGESGVRAGE